MIPDGRETIHEQEPAAVQPFSGGAASDTEPGASPLAYEPRGMSALEHAEPAVAVPWSGP